MIYTLDIRRAMPSFSFLPSLFLFFFLSLNTRLCNGSNSITPTQPLTGTQTITSKAGVFELGSFTPSNSSQNSYIGIWYKKVATKTLVWVANRETPLANTTNSILKISSDGNLVLLGPSNLPIWSTNLTSLPSNSTAAVLLDSGNLVLIDGAGPSIIYWQSFDHPTDTLLPGARLGLNKVTGEKQRLTSWKTREDPAPGPFSLEIDTNESTRCFLVWNGTERYWSTGNWDGQIFSGVPEMAVKYIYNFSFVNNETVKYFTYSLSNPSASILSRMVMDVQGQTRQLTWLEGPKEWTLHYSHPQSYCQVYAPCGSFGICSEKMWFSCTCLPGFTPKVQKDWDLGSWSDGCMRRTPLQVAENSTSHVDTDRFWALPAMKLPAKSESSSAASAEECKMACLNKRRCTAYAFGSGCMIWNGDLINLEQLSDGDVHATTLFLRLAASEVPISKSKTGIIAVKILGSIIGLGFARGIVLFLIRRYRRQRKKVLMAAVAQGSLVAFSYRDLQSVTKNFSDKLGGGGFGSVFKGTLPDLYMVAVKKLEGLRQGEKQFRAEVSTIGTIQHINLIRLRGFCSEGDQKLLVYDYMPNGSLNSHLFGTTRCLDWSRRYQIAIETARGIAYLHEKCQDCIIHCDIKPENILLDSAFCVKVADFGLAKLFGREFSHVLTTLRGTIGYVAPEWLSGLAITSKADVYSYGMMLFEIISGRRNRKESVNGQTTFFPTWAMSKISVGEVEYLLDDRLEGNSNLQELHRACRVAGWCIQDHENDRPSMGQIVQILEGVLEVSVPPMPRLLQILDENCDVISSLNRSSAPSNASTPSQAKS